MHAQSSPDPEANPTSATDGDAVARPTDKTPAETAKSTQPRRHRRLLPRRWSLRLPFLLILLLLVLALITQVVLWTNVPRDLVIGQLEKQLGLRVSAASLTTGWLGDTKLRDVSIALPLSADDQTLVRVPEMRVQHTSLIGLLATRAVTLKLVELRDAHVLVHQDAGGRWNVQEVAELLARAAGKETAAEQKTSRPELPSLRIFNATVEVVDRGGRRTVIQPVNVVGEPQDALTWKYDAGLGVPRTAMPADAPGIGVTGRVVTGGNWAHEVKIWGRNVDAWAQPWAPSPLPSVAFSGEWNGALTAGAGVSGRLVLEGINVSGVRAGGAFAVNTEGAGVVLRPENLLVETNRVIVPELRLTAGRIVVDAKSATVDNVTFLGVQGAARVNGRYDWGAGAADVTAYWSDLQVPGKGRLTHFGSLTASLRRPLPGQLAVKLEMTSTGKVPAGDVWNADLALNGSGRAWNDIDWEFQARRFTLNAPRPLNLDGIAASVQTRQSSVSLTSVRGPGQVVARGAGRYEVATKDWNFRLDLDNLPHPAGLTNTPNSLTINARGTQEYSLLEDPGLSIRGGDAELRVNGSYVFNVPKPVDVRVNLSHVPPRDPTNDQPPFRGYLHGEARVTGTAVPTDLVIVGTLTGRDVVVGDRYVGEVKADLTGGVDVDKRVTLHTTEFDALGGKWQVDAVFPDQAALGLNVKVTNLPLANVGTLLHSPQLEGTADARLALLVPQPKADSVKVSGVVNARNIRCGPTANADSLEASLVLADGTLRVDPVRLRKGEGQADLAAEMDVREYRRLTASLTFAAWPFEPSPGTKAELWGGTRGLRITLPGATLQEGVRRGIYRPEFKASKLWVTGPIDLSAILTLNEKPAGDLHLVAQLDGRSVDLRSLAYDGTDGSMQGQAVFNVDKPFEARGSLFFEDFNAERLSDFFPDRPALVGLAGRYNGSVHVGPAPGPWPLEPLRIQARVQNVGGQYRSIPIGPIQLSAFTNFDRLVIDDSPQDPTMIAFAGGLVRLWGRATLLEPGQELSPAATKPLLLSQLQVTLGRVDVDQIVHAFKPDSEKMPGKLSGSINLLAGTRPGRRPGAAPSGQGAFEKTIRRITATGQLEIADSDLANLDLLSFLYSAMSAKDPGGPPTGKGDLALHLEDGQLTLNNVHYFNRGTEARAIIQIDEIWRLPDSPIRGSAAGTARPFRDIKLPFLSNYNLDTIMTALQTDLTTVAVNGTVKDPKVGTVAFSDLGEGMRRLLIGDFEKERGAAGK